MDSPSEIIAIGTAFSSSAEFFDFLTDYQSRTYQCFSKERCEFRTLNGVRVHGEYARVHLKCVCGVKEQRDRGTKGIRNFQNTYWRDCESFIKLHYKTATKKLTVIQANFQHNHELSAVLNSFLPKSRRLSAALQEESKKLLAMGTPATAVRNAMQLKTGQKVLSKDIQNLRTAQKKENRTGKTEIQILEDVLTEAKAADPALVYKFDKDDVSNEVKVLVFISSQMKAANKEFGEVVFMDSTYGLTAERYPLYLLAAQDGSGYTRPVAIAFVTEDTAENVSSFLRLFKECHSDEEITRTAVVFIDKDRKELAALRDQLGHVKVLLCWFHVIRVVSTKVATLDVSKDTKQEIFSTFQKCMYAFSERIYLESKNQLINLAPQCFSEYFLANWENCRPLWVAYYRNSLRRFGNNTTNRVEGLKNAIKIIFRAIQKTPMKFADAVRTLFIFLQMRDTGASYKDHLNALKTTYVHDQQFGSILAEIGKLLTEQATRLVFSQLKKGLAEILTYKIQDLGDGLTVLQNTKSKVYYSLHREENVYSTSQLQVFQLTCSCIFNCSFGLPCRHILFLRKSFHNNKFESVDCLERWFRDYQGPDVAFLPMHLAEYSVEHLDQIEDEDKEVPAKNIVMSQQRRFHEAMDVLKDIASIAAEFGGSEFQSCILLLRKFREVTYKPDMFARVTEWLTTEILTRAQTPKSTSGVLEKPVLEFNSHLPKADLCKVQPLTIQTDIDNQVKQVEPKLSAKSSEMEPEKRIILPFRLSSAALKTGGRPKGRKGIGKRFFSKVRNTMKSRLECQQTDQRHISKAEKRRQLYRSTFVKDPVARLVRKHKNEKKKECTTENLDTTIHGDITSAAACNASFLAESSLTKMNSADTLESRIIAGFDFLALLFLETSIVSLKIAGNQQLAGQISSTRCFQGHLKYTCLLPDGQILSNLTSIDVLAAFNMLPAALLQTVHWKAWCHICSLLQVDGQKETTVTQQITWTSSNSFWLSYSEKLRIENDQWLGDEVIRSAQVVLHHQFPQLCGLLDPLMYSHNGANPEWKEVAHDREDIQILRNGELEGWNGRSKPEKQLQILFLAPAHWVAVSNVLNDTQEVMVYDSLPPNPSTWFINQVAAVFRFQNYKEFEIQWPDFERQSNQNDCGVIAIAVCVAVAYGVQPYMLSVNLTKARKHLLMRQHITECLERYHFCLFETHRISTRKPSTVTILAEKTPPIKIICKCRMPLFSPSERTVQCNGKDCKLKFFHESCVKDHTERTTRSSKAWTCDECSQYT